MCVQKIGLNDITYQPGEPEGVRRDSAIRESVLLLDHPHSRAVAQKKETERIQFYRDSNLSVGRSLGETSSSSNVMIQGFPAAAAANAVAASSDNAESTPVHALAHETERRESRGINAMAQAKVTAQEHHDLYNSDVAAAVSVMGYAADVNSGYHMPANAAAAAHLNPHAGYDHGHVNPILLPVNQ